MVSLIKLVSYACIGVGIWFWFWGTLSLLNGRSVLFKLHTLSVGDTLGSILIIFGLLLRRPQDFPLLFLAIISLTVWNTMLGYVIAYSSTSDEYDQAIEETLIEASSAGSTGRSGGKE